MSCESDCGTRLGERVVAEGDSGKMFREACYLNGKVMAGRRDRCGGRGDSLAADAIGSEAS
jgi:hypothetical protein